MKKNLQTILGAGGAIGTELAKALPVYTDHIRLVSRNPKKVNPSDELMSANLLNTEELRKAVEDSSVVYLTVGFKYHYKTWKKKWPQLIKNLIIVCEETGAKLVFFDNVYMYHEDAMAKITEDAPIDPPSRKGKIRANIAKLILDRVKEGEITALIARSADFYGPRVETSVLTQTVVKPLQQGKEANWLGSIDYKHSFTYVPDAAKATALLGNTEDAFNQVWHLPTADKPPTGREWIAGIAAEMQVTPQYRSLSKFMVRIIGLFVPVMREIPEMMYQYDRDYIFRSDKFKQHFDFKPTPYTTGIREMLRAERHN